MLPADAPRVFFDADVLIAGSASTAGASHLLVRLSELGLLRGLTCPQAMREAERNIREKVPAAYPAFRALLAVAIRAVEEAKPESLGSLQGFAHENDLPILACALEAHCAYLTTFNVRHYRIPSSRIRVIRPGELVTRLRRALSGPI